MTKYPYGIAVRIRGDSITGYRIQYTFNYHRYLFFLTNWYDYNGYNTNNLSNLEAAKVVALDKYNRMLSFKIQDAEWRRKLRNNNGAVWRYPNGEQA